MGISKAWLLMKLILLQNYYIFAELTHRGEDREINVLVISCEIRAEAEGQSRLTGSQGWYHTLNLVNVT